MCVCVCVGWGLRPKYEVESVEISFRRNKFRLLSRSDVITLQHG